MASELATSKRRVERGTIELERKHVEVEGRRRYIETILERITTGVVSVDASGVITTINSAAARLLSLNRNIVGQQTLAVFDRADLQPLGNVLGGVGRGKAEPVAHDIVLVAIEHNWEAIRAHKDSIGNVLELILRDGIAAGEFEPVDPRQTAGLINRSMVDATARRSARRRP